MYVTVENARLHPGTLYTVARENHYDMQFVTSHIQEMQKVLEIISAAIEPYQ
jgi:hypothetical protein